MFVPRLVPVDVTLLQDHVLFTLLQRQIMSLQPFKVIQRDHHFLLRPRLFLCFLWWGRGWPPSLEVKKHQLKTRNSLIRKSLDAASVRSRFHTNLIRKLTNEPLLSSPGTGGRGLRETVRKREQERFIQYRKINKFCCIRVC